MYCCSKLSYIYSIFIVYYSAGMLFFLTHFLKKMLCLLTHDIGCIVVNEIDVILKLLTWARIYNILFHKNKTIYFRIYVDFPHPGLNVSARTFLVSRDRREK